MAITQTHNQASNKPVDDQTLIHNQEFNKPVEIIPMPKLVSNNQDVQTPTHNQA